MYYYRRTITKSITVIIYLVFFLFLLDSVTFCDIGADPVPCRRNYVRLWLLYVESAVSSWIRPFLRQVFASLLILYVGFYGL